MSDLSLLLWIAAAACIVAPWLICRSLPPVENNSRAIRRYVEKHPTDRYPDGDGRVASRPGSTRFAPGTGCAVSALTGDDPSRGGDARAFNQGD